MSRFIVIVLLALVACLSGASAVRAEPNAASFTQEVAQALTRALPARTVTVTRDLQLAIKEADGTQTTLSLANLFGDYQRDPARFAAIVEVYVSALSAPKPASGGGEPARLNRTRIVPLVKDRQWLDDNHRGLKASGITQEHVFDELNAELVVVYAEDSANRVRYLMSTEDIGVDRRELRKLAVDNLSRMLPKVEMRQHGDDFAMISAGGDYEASLLLLDDIWSGGQMKVNGDIVVAIPAKDVLLVTGSRNRKGLSAVRKLATEFAGQQRYRLTETLFVYRNGGFVKFGRN
jgi:uncharacterized protein YtpQ (UPF0354 family)